MINLEQYLIENGYSETIAKETVYAYIGGGFSLIKKKLTSFFDNDKEVDILVSKVEEYSKLLHTV